jgi:hypothetical protein
MVDWLVGQGGGERERGGIGEIGVGVREVEGWLVRWMGTERDGIGGSERERDLGIGGWLGMWWSDRLEVFLGLQ